MMQWCKQNKFWILLGVNACLGIFLGWISLLLSYVFIWLNYKFSSKMKKMLILDAILLASTQAGAWVSLFRWMNQEEKKAACITGGLAALQILLYIFFRIRIDY